MGLSERRACSIVGADRKMVRYRSRRPPDGELRARLLDLVNDRRRFGYGNSFAGALAGVAGRRMKRGFPNGRAPRLGACSKGRETLPFGGPKDGVRAKSAGALIVAA